MIVKIEIRINMLTVVRLMLVMRVGIGIVVMVRVIEVFVGLVRRIRYCVVVMTVFRTVEVETRTIPKFNVRKSKRKGRKKKVSCFSENIARFLANKKELYGKKKNPSLKD